MNSSHFPQQDLILQTQMKLEQVRDRYDTLKQQLYMQQTLNTKFDSFIYNKQLSMEQKPRERLRNFLLEGVLTSALGGWAVLSVMETPMNAPFKEYEEYATGPKDIPLTASISRPSTAKRMASTTITSSMTRPTTAHGMNRPRPQSSMRPQSALPFSDSTMNESAISAEDMEVNELASVDEDPFELDRLLDTVPMIEPLIATEDAPVDSLLDIFDASTIEACYRTQRPQRVGDGSPCWLIPIVVQHRVVGLLLLAPDEEELMDFFSFSEVVITKALQRTLPRMWFMCLHTEYLQSQHYKNQTAQEKHHVTLLDANIYQIMTHYTARRTTSMHAMEDAIHDKVQRVVNLMSGAMGDRPLFLVPLHTADPQLFKVEHNGPLFVTCFRSQQSIIAQRAILELLDDHHEFMETKLHDDSADQFTLNVPTIQGDIIPFRCRFIVHQKKIVSLLGVSGTDASLPEWLINDICPSMYNYLHTYITIYHGHQMHRLEKAYEHAIMKHGNKKQVVLGELKTTKVVEEDTVVDSPKEEPLPEEATAYSNLSPDVYDNATVAYIDLSGYHAVAAKVPSSCLFTFIQQTMTALDKLTKKYKLIRGASAPNGYLVVANMLGNRSESPVADVIDFVLEAQTVILNMERPIQLIKAFFKPQCTFTIATGQICAGTLPQVASHLLPSSQSAMSLIQPPSLFGVAVSMVHLLAPHTPSNTIAVSESSYKAAQNLNRYHFDRKKKVQAKGVGFITVYPLQSKRLVPNDQFLATTRPKAATPSPSHSTSFSNLQFQGSRSLLSRSSPFSFSAGLAPSSLPTIQFQ
mmetsp:Transcript_8082/g.12024  ORF Transcript_8082/g.12024 Transcript_8082/m.12024 type:complete len:806 (+) Transcript_8082:1-2418(+)